MNPSATQAFHALDHADPLAVAALYLKLTPDVDERNALRALLQALIDQGQPSALRDPRLFQGELGSLVAALLDAHMTGRYSVDALRSALG